MASLFSDVFLVIRDNTTGATEAFSSWMEEATWNIENKHVLYAAVQTQYDHTDVHIYIRIY